MTRLLSCIVCTLLLFSSCYKEVGVPVSIDFTYKLKDEHVTVPAYADIMNRTTGATSFKWTFEGGEPEVSSYQNPGTIVFRTAGKHKITLEAWNEDERQTKTIEIQLDSSVNILFDTTILINHYSPVEVAIKNNTIGASTYNWTFEGGNPATFSGAQPPNVTFTTPGEHAVTLSVSNGGQQFVLTKKITVLPALVNGFDMQAAFKDDDGEAPLTLQLQSKAGYYITQQWRSDGGQLQSDTASSNSLFFPDPGTYHITLKVANGKETKEETKEIVVKPNSGLRTLRDVKFGIAANKDYGQFYSILHRTMYTQTDDIATVGKEIDLGFFGLSQTFTVNKFISPDSSAKGYPFKTIPGATYTRYFNSQENCGCGVTVSNADFDNLTNSQWLRQLRLPAGVNESTAFDQTLVPRIVPFETADGRRGLIKIRQFVSNGQLSYILTDIKVEKFKDE
ncbi:PKD domain-containing protein [Chitinophaga dinghuensis]|uniref:PKD domain-containing protein n=1 Tax=Chitinophaga dinghuensis TaxID=1539050 RepID=A0A327WAK7_9BACT|nr:PKD domain-containing protein [Chitinophaga dinghuensis]RAJ87613.1 PKD domain-containing protein [Chitinophaga dinghuensis]